MASVFGFAEIKSKIYGWGAGLAEVGQRRFTRPPASAKLAAKGIGNGDGDYDLSQLLEKLVIPRLIADQLPARRVMPQMAAKAAPAKGDCPSGMDEAEVARFADLAITGDAPQLMDFVEASLASGHSVETIYIDLLAPAARRLGTNWEDDTRDFVDVTMGLWRIQEVLRELAARIPPHVGTGQGRRAALFSTMPGEQHSFGTLMIASCFERAGWDCDVLIEPTTSELTGKLAHNHYDLAGLTVSCDCSSGAVAGVVSALRAVSSNPGVRIMVGGRCINARPELLAESGADATAADAPSAVRLADVLVPTAMSIFDAPI